jgi:hypothetical protein
MLRRGDVQNVDKVMKQVRSNLTLQRPEYKNYSNFLNINTVQCVEFHVPFSSFSVLYITWHSHTSIISLHFT